MRTPNSKILSSHLEINYKHIFLFYVCTEEPIFDLPFKCWPVMDTHSAHTHSQSDCNGTRYIFA